MKLPRPTFRFSLRAMLLFVAAVSCYLTWSLWDSEKLVVAEIERAGGRAYRHYENASISDIWISVGMLPGVVYLDTVQIATNPASQQTPGPTAWEILCGTYKAKRTTVVDLPLDCMTPDMVEKLLTLRELQGVVVRVTGGVMLGSDSPGAKRLEELRIVFSGRLHPTYAKGD